MGVKLFKVLLKILFVSLLLGPPAFAQQWVRYSSYVNDQGDTVPLLFDPSSVERVDYSVFVCTTVEDPMDKGTIQYGLKTYLEINKSRIRLLRMEPQDGSSEDFKDPEWDPIEDGTTDFDLYNAVVNVLKSKDS